jgi:hypothetical protein
VLVYCLGSFGGAKAIFDVTCAVWFSKPKLKGTVEDIRFPSNPMEIRDGGHFGYVAVLVHIVNTRAERTTVSAWSLNIEDSSGPGKLMSLPVPNWWDGVLEPYRPTCTEMLEDRRLIFEQNIMQCGWLFFPYDELDNCLVRVLIARDARGVEHKIEVGKAERKS